MKSFSDYIVDVSAMRHNINTFKTYANGSKICAVVKANGYGHGLKNFVPKIDDIVDSYAVACFYEAINLRKYTKKDILVLNYVPVSNLFLCKKNNISISLFNVVQLKEIINEKCIKNLKVHVALNTGMNRIGLSSKAEVGDFFKVVTGMKNKIKVAGIFTHIYNSESEKDTKHQIDKFVELLSEINKFVDTSKLCLHTSASMPTMLYKNYCFNMTRLGLAMYGYAEKPFDKKFTPVLTIKTKVIAINNIKKGESVGYGKNYIAKTDMTVATIPIGYADGIMRTYSKHGRVLIDNQSCKILGNICMDMFMCDVTGKNVKLFDEVLILGKNSDKNYIFADEIAQKCNTISYEVLTNIKQNRFNVLVIE